LTLLHAEFALQLGGFSLNVEFSLDDGVLVLFGPSGAGKTLTVAVLAGAIRPDSGRIQFRDKVLFDSATKTHLAAAKRGFGYVPQHNALFPHCSVGENVAFGLPRSRRRGRDPAVEQLLDELDLRGLADARPESLSGGERQRVALARALVVEPELLLLDEPFAALDQTARAKLRGLLKEVLERRQTPAVLVTHSVGEALALGDQVVRYESGRTEAAGDPREVLADLLIRIEGVVGETQRGAVEGVTQLRLQEAHLEGPENLVRGASGDRIQWDLPYEPDN